jgi:hypothetical protein
MTKQQMTSKFGKKGLAKFALIVAALSLSLPLSMPGGASAASSAIAPYTLDEDANFRILSSGALTVGDNSAGLSDDLDFTFSAPGVNPAAAAVLMLRVRGVQCSGNSIKINNVEVSNALVPRDSDEIDDFYTEIGLVPGNVLKASGNTFKMTSTACTPAGDPGNRDDFTVDNVVLIYRQP